MCGADVVDVTGCSLVSVLSRSADGVFSKADLYNIVDIEGRLLE